MMDEGEVRGERLSFDDDYSDYLSDEYRIDAKNAKKLIQDGQTYVGNFTVYDDGNLVEDTTTLTNDVSITDRTVEYETGAGDVIRVKAAAGQEISGTTSLAPGTELDLRLRGTGSSSFLENPKPVVESDRSFTATVDLSDRASNTTFEASARNAGDSDAQDGVIGDAVTASVTFENQTLQDGAVTVAKTTMSEGGFIAIHQGDASGDIIGTSEFLSAGSHEDVSISLDSDLASNQTLVAMAHQDDGDQEFNAENDSAYMKNGSAVIDSATVSVSDTTPTTDDTTPTTDESTPTDTATETNESDEGSSGDGAGFTAGIALVALLGAALLAARRNN